MNNAEKFNEVFGSYATELWAKSEAELLEWLWGAYSAVSAPESTGKVDCADKISFKCGMPRYGGEYMVLVRDESGDSPYEYVTSAVYLMIDHDRGMWVKDDEWLYGVIGWCDFPDTCKVNIGE